MMSLEDRIYFVRNKYNATFTMMGQLLGMNGKEVQKIYYKEVQRRKLESTITPETSIRNLNLSIKLQNVLYRNHIRTVGQLLNRANDLLDLMSLKGIALKNARAIEPELVRAKRMIRGLRHDCPEK